MSAKIIDFPRPVSYKTILTDLAERDDIAHIVVIVETKEGFNELYWDKQERNRIVFASAVLGNIASQMAAEATIGEFL